MPNIVTLWVGMAGFGAAHDGPRRATDTLLLSAGHEMVGLAKRYFRVDSDLRRRNQE
jgi:hypothetical protein